MPKASESLTRARRAEIINACAVLYETMGFRDITIRDIGANTSFTRTAIYNYFQTKEEIFLALLQREHEAWRADLEAILQAHATLSAAAFAEELARTLEKRARMLKLMSMNLYDMEGNSSIEALVSFKRTYAGVTQTIARCLETFFPSMTPEGIQDFLYAFLPFLFGVYPYTMPTDKQKAAMELAHVSDPRYSIYELVQSFVSKLLRGL